MWYLWNETERSELPIVNWMVLIVMIYSHLLRVFRCIARMKQFLELLIDTAVVFSSFPFIKICYEDKWSCWSEVWRKLLKICCLEAGCIVRNGERCFTQIYGGQWALSKKILMNLFYSKDENHQYFSSNFSQVFLDPPECTTYCTTLYFGLCYK